MLAVFTGKTDIVVIRIPCQVLKLKTYLDCMEVKDMLIIDLNQFLIKTWL